MKGTCSVRALLSICFTWLTHKEDTLPFFQAYLRCKFSEPDWDASLRVTAYERTHLQHAGYVKTRFFVLPHTSPKVERADPRHHCGIVKHDRRGELRFAFAAQTARRGHFMRGYEAESGCIFHQHLLTDMNQGWCQTQISILLTAHLCLINDWARCCHDYPAERPSGVHSVSSPLPITLTLSSDTQESLPLDSAWAVKCRDHIS